MIENLMYYLLRAIGACEVKTYRQIIAPDDMAAVKVEVEFVFEKVKYAQSRILLMIGD